MNGPLTTLGLLVAPGLPLALALLWSVPRLRPGIRRWVPWTPLPALLLAVFGRPGDAIELSWLLLGSSLGLTSVTQVFLFFTALIWLVAGIYGRNQRSTEAGCERYCIFWLLTLTGNLAMILALDVPLFYTSFALMTFAAYGLIVYHGSPEAQTAGRVYLVLAVLGEALILVGLILAARGTATPLLPLLADLPAAIAAAPERDLIIAGLWLGFGIKAGLPLLHFSLPLAYATAPIAAATVLAGAMIKAGLLGWLLTLPLGATDLQAWGGIMLYTGLFAMFAGALVGINQVAPRVVLAYSSISQMGAFSVALGIWFLRPELGPALGVAIVIYALHHALAKAALFLGVDAIRHTPNRRWLAWGAVILPAVALSGLLPSGLFAKAALKAEAGALAPVFPGTLGDLTLLLALAAIGTTLLMARYLWLLRPTAGRIPALPSAARNSWLLLVLATVFGVFLLPWWGFRLDWAAAVAGLTTAAWPVGVGLVLALLAWPILRPLPIPAADILPLLTPLPRLALRIGLALGLTGPALGRGLGRIQEWVSSHYRRADVWFGRASEQFWRRDAMLLFALLLALAAGAGWMW